MRKFLFIILVMVISCLNITAQNYNKAVIFVINEKNFYINGKQKQAVMAPYLKNDRVFVPLRLISENFSADVKWIEETQSIKITAGGKNISMTIGEKSISVDNTPKILDAVPEIINDITFVPLRAIAEALGKQVGYKDNVIIISDEVAEFPDEFVTQIKEGVYFSNLEAAQNTVNLVKMYSPVHIGTTVVFLTPDGKLKHKKGAVKENCTVYDKTKISAISGDCGVIAALQEDGKVFYGINMKYNVDGYTLTNRKFRKPVLKFNKLEIEYNTDDLVVVKGDSNSISARNGLRQVDPYDYINYHFNIDGMENILFISGGEHILGIRKDGKVLAYGNNKYGEIGNGSREDPEKAVEVKGLERIIYVKAAKNSSFAINQDGSLWAWGNNIHGMLGDGTDINRLNPVKIEGVPDIVDIETNSLGAVARTDDGYLYTWGKIGETENLKPAKINGISDVNMVSISDKRTLVLKNDSSLWVCRNTELFDTESKFQKIETGLENIRYIKAYNNATFVVDGKGRLWGWGIIPVNFDNKETEEEYNPKPVRYDGYNDGEVKLP